MSRIVPVPDLNMDFTGIASIWAGLVLLLAVVVIVHRVLSFTTVTIQSIYGALSAYLITGLRRPPQCSPTRAALLRQPDQRRLGRRQQHTQRPAAAHQDRCSGTPCPACWPGPRHCQSGCVCSTANRGCSQS
jgi:hypothetical protein